MDKPVRLLILAPLSPQTKHRFRLSSINLHVTFTVTLFLSVQLGVSVHTTDSKEDGVATAMLFVV